MRLHSFASIAFTLFVAACTIKEVRPQNAAATPPPAPAPAPVAATPTATPAPATPTATPATNTGGLIGAGIAKLDMVKPNIFGKDKPFTGAIEGHVFDIPAGTNSLPAPSDWFKLKQIATLWSQSWDISARDFKDGFPGVPGNKDEWFAIHWDGTINVTKAGTYNFKMISDDGARLMLDDQLVVNDDGLHAPKEATGSYSLTSGPHHLVIDYFQGPKWQIALQIFVSSPNMMQKPLTSSF